MKNAVKAFDAYFKRGSHSLKDKNLENELFALLSDLELKVDEIAPTVLRHKLSELIVEMRAQIWAFDQSKSHWR